MSAFPPSRPVGYGLGRNVAERVRSPGLGDQAYERCGQPRFSRTQTQFSVFC